MAHRPRAIGHLYVTTHLVKWSFEDRVPAEIGFAIAAQDHVGGTNSEELVLELDPVQALTTDLFFENFIIACVLEHAVHRCYKERSCASCGIKYVVTGRNIDELRHERGDVLRR